MDFIMNNWYIVLAFVAVVASIVCVVAKFFHLPSETQLNKVREWLVYATFEAEKALGSKTGQLKLRSVYDKFVDKFPWLVRVITFEKFSDLVDDALPTVREMIKGNEAVANLVNNEFSENS